MLYYIFKPESPVGMLTKVERILTQRLSLHSEDMARLIEDGRAHDELYNNRKQEVFCAAKGDLETSQDKPL